MGIHPEIFWVDFLLSLSWRWVTYLYVIYNIEYIWI